MTPRTMGICDKMSLDYCIRQSVIVDVLHSRADCFKFLSSRRSSTYLNGFEDEGMGNGKPRNGEPRSNPLVALPRAIHSIFRPPLSIHTRN